MNTRIISGNIVMCSTDDTDPALIYPPDLSTLQEISWETQILPKHKDESGLRSSSPRYRYGAQQVMQGTTEPFTLFTQPAGVSFHNSVKCVQLLH